MNSIKKLLAFSILTSLCSCSKKNEISQNNALITPIAATPIVKTIDSTATYKITITGTWKNPEHTIPNNEHFTQFVGLIHGANGIIYSVGNLATKGIEDVAEVGRSVVLEAEMNEKIIAGKALSPFYITIQGIIGAASTNATVNTKNSLVSFISMIAPSPDWFAGIDNYNLIQNGEWIKDVTIPVFGYDAGTEDGDVFGYNNPATTPQKPVQLMTPAKASVIANGNSMIAPFATVRFEKL